MILCIPITENKGLKSEVYSHFGSASAFLLYDSEKESEEIVVNSDNEHTHGMCEPMKSISNRNIHSVIVGGIGKRALEKLHSMKIKVYKSESKTVVENIELFNKSLLKEFTPDDGCDHNIRRHQHYCK